MGKNSSSRQSLALIVSLTVGAIAIVTALGWYYLRERAAIEGGVTRELTAIATIKVAQIANWRRERLGDGRVFQSSAMMRIAKRVLSSPVIQPEDRADLLDVTQNLEREFLYTGAALVDRKGSIRLESNVGPFDPLRIGELGKAAAGSSDVSLQDLYWDTKQARPLMALCVPVQGLGAYVFTIDPDRFLYPFMKTWPAPSATGQTVLVRLEGKRILLLSDPPHEAIAPLRFSVPADSPNRIEGDKKVGWAFRRPDYRGITVLGIVRPIPDSPWFVVAKMDASEADAPVRRLGWEMASLVALIALVTASGAGFIWRNQQMRMYRQREEYLRQMADETPAFLWTSAPNGKAMFINKPLAEFVGGPQNQTLRDSWRIHLHPEDVGRVSQNYFDCVADRCEFLDEHRLRRFDGEYRWFLAKGVPGKSRQGYSGSLFDITERRMAEQRAHETAELLAGQNRVLELIVQNSPLEEILNTLVRVIEALSPEMLASILLLDGDGLRLVRGAAPSLPETYNRAIEGEPIGPAAGSCGTAAFLREPVIVEDIATHPFWENYREVALQHGLRACWSTPIFQENRGEERFLLGTFALYFRSPGLPTPRHRELIAMATQTAAIAIVKAREGAALGKSEERLRLAAGAANLGIWEWQIDTGRLIWSDDLKGIFEWRAGGGDLSIGMIFAAIHAEDRERVERTLREAVAHHVDYEAEYRILLKDGTLRWIASQGRAQYDASGAPVRMLGVSRDVTPRKHAEEEIKRREAQLVEAQRIAQVGSYEWDISAHRVYRSAELCKILDDAFPDEFEPDFESYFERVHPEDRASVRERFQESLRDGKPFDHEERIVLRDGSHRVLRSQGRWLCDDAGNPVRLMGTYQDITDRKQAEQELKAANAALADELKERARTEQEIKALSSRLINAQEEERTRLARELHDDLSQQIASLSIGLSNLKRAIPSEFDYARAESERIREKLVDLAESTRRLSHELHPAILEHCGVDIALRAFCSEFGTLSGMEVTFHSKGSSERVPPNVALCVYRVAQEALQNIVKHARTARADVALTLASESVRLRVSDRGVGMDLKVARMGGGLGLTSIRERTRLVNGIVDIQSVCNQGTILTVTLPVPAGEYRPFEIAQE